MTVEEFLKKDFPSVDRESILFLLKGNVCITGIGPYLVVEKTYNDHLLLPGIARSFDKEDLLKFLDYEYGFVPKTVYLLNSIIKEFEEELL